MTVFLVPNLSKKQAVCKAQAAIDVLRGCGAFVLLDCAFQHLFDAEKVSFLPEDAAFAACDVIVTIGGDGTMLHTARRSMVYQKPLLGVNIGRMGFLATVEAYELEKLERLVKQEYTLDKRGILDVFINDQHNVHQTALNEVVIGKNMISQTIDVKIYCDDILVNQYLGDGVIIATPTGSTAYSLSAGGPVLDARIAGIVVTPVCAHSMHSPPMVFSADRKLKVMVASATRSNAFLSCDGMPDEPLAENDSVLIAFSDQSISLVCFNEADQFEAIDKKLKGR